MKKPRSRVNSLRGFKDRRRPTLPPLGSTIGADGLNFPVRYGKGWTPSQWPPETFRCIPHHNILTLDTMTSEHFLVQTIPPRGRPRDAGAQAYGLLVPLGCVRHRTCTCGLSTWSSPTALKRDLISWRVSRLYAFSAYPFRTWLPSGAPGGTTGTPAVRPSRSSRTRDRPTQISRARCR